MEKRQRKDFHCQNRKCRAVVGSTDGENLWSFKGEKFPLEPVLLIFDCPECGAPVRWQNYLQKARKSRIL